VFDQGSEAVLVLVVVREEPSVRLAEVELRWYARSESVRDLDFLPEIDVRAVHEVQISQPNRMANGRVKSAVQGDHRLFGQRLVNAREAAVAGVAGDWRSQCASEAFLKDVLP
jgi:hypothetical protein